MAGLEFAPAPGLCGASSRSWQSSTSSWSLTPGPAAAPRASPKPSKQDSRVKGQHSFGPGAAAERQLLKPSLLCKCC